MRILYLCHRIPYPPDKGEKIRAFQELTALAGRHEVDLFTLADDPGDMAHRDTLAAHCRSVTVAPVNPRLARILALPYLLTTKALTLPYFHSAELAVRVRQALAARSYDRIFVYCSAMAPYTDGVTDIPVVVDLVDVDSDKWLQYAAFTAWPMSLVYRREGLTLRRFERAVCQRSASVVVSTRREARLLQEVAGVDAHVIANGVDTEFFQPGAVALEERPPEIVFTGDMSYFPNQEAVVFFARKVLPLVRQSVPEARFSIVGRNPGPRVREVARPGEVEVTGFVPDVRTYLGRARIAVAPFTIAAGIQNKILEAMACGLPVATTSRTIQGLSEAAAALVEIGDTPQEMASKIVRLLRDLPAARRLGDAGRRLVSEEYRWEDAHRQLRDLIENVNCNRLKSRALTKKSSRRKSF